MDYLIEYGEICDAWEENWGNAGGDPFEVLKERHGISFDIGSGWYGFHLWADKHCTDRVEIDWGSRAWKCKGKELIDLDGWGTTKVRDVESVDPDKTYGVVFIEMS